MNESLLMAGMAMMICGSVLFSVCCILIYYNCAKQALTSLTKPASSGTQQSTKQSQQKQSTTVPTSSSPSSSVGYEIPAGIKTDCPQGKRGIIGWEHAWRDGKSYMWCNSDSGGKNSGINVIGNDKLSYLSIPTGMKATVYENVNMGGLVKAFDAGEWNLHEYTFDNGKKLADRASSIKVEGTPQNSDVTGATQFSNMGR